MIGRVIKRVVHAAPSTLIRAAAVLTLLGLAAMVWSMLYPTPLPVILAMSAGQVLGTLAFLLFGIAVFKDLRRNRVEPPVSAP